jgi:hypothetical protein
MRVLSSVLLAAHMHDAVRCNVTTTTNFTGSERKSGIVELLPLLPLDISHKSQCVEYSVVAHRLSSSMHTQQQYNTSNIVWSAVRYSCILASVHPV